MEKMGVKKGSENPILGLHCHTFKKQFENYLV